MDESSLRRAAHAGTPHPPPVVDTALRYYLIVARGSSFGNGDVQKCRQLASAIASDGEAGDAAYSGTVPEREPTPFQRFDRAERLAATGGTVRGVRREMFGSEEAPWTPEQYPDAVRWLEAEHERTHRSPTGAEEIRVRELEEQARQLARELFTLTGAAGVSLVSCEYEWLRFVRVEPPGVPRLRIGRDSPLLPLARETARLARALGCSQADLVAYVLTGEPPFLPRVRVHRLGKWISRGYREPLNGSDYQREFVEIRLEDPDLSERDLRGLFREIRGQFTEKPEDRALRQILRGMGGVPERPPLAFWREALRRWTAAGLPVRGAADPSRGARALSRRFDRLPPGARDQLRRIAK